MCCEQEVQILQNIKEDTLRKQFSINGHEQNSKGNGDGSEQEKTLLCR